MEKFGTDTSFIKPSTGSGARGSSDGSMFGKTGPIVLSKDDAKNPSRYRTAKAEALKEGRDLQIAE